MTMLIMNVELIVKKLLIHLMKLLITANLHLGS